MFRNTNKLFSEVLGTNQISNFVEHNFERFNIISHIKQTFKRPSERDLLGLTSFGKHTASNVEISKNKRLQNSFKLQIENILGTSNNVEDRKNYAYKNLTKVNTANKNISEESIFRKLKEKYELKENIRNYSEKNEAFCKDEGMQQALPNLGTVRKKETKFHQPKQITEKFGESKNKEIGCSLEQQIHRKDQNVFINKKNKEKKRRLKTGTEKPCRSNTHGTQQSIEAGKTLENDTTDTSLKQPITKNEDTPKSIVSSNTVAKWEHPNLGSVRKKETEFNLTQQIADKGKMSKSPLKLPENQKICENKNKENNNINMQWNQHELESLMEKQIKSFINLSHQITDKYKVLRNKENSINMLKESIHQDRNVLAKDNCKLGFVVKKETGISCPLQITNPVGDLTNDGCSNLLNHFAIQNGNTLFKTIYKLEPLAKNETGMNSAVQVIDKVSDSINNKFGNILGSFHQKDQMILENQLKEHIHNGSKNIKANMQWTKWILGDANDKEVELTSVQLIISNGKKVKNKDDLQKITETYWNSGNGIKTKECGYKGTQQMACVIAKISQLAENGNNLGGKVFQADQKLYEEINKQIGSSKNPVKQNTLSIGNVVPKDKDKDKFTSPKQIHVNNKNNCSQSTKPNRASMWISNTGISIPRRITNNYGPLIKKKTYFSLHPTTVRTMKTKQCYCIKRARQPEENNSNGTDDVEPLTKKNCSNKNKHPCVAKDQLCRKKMNLKAIRKRFKRSAEKLQDNSKQNKKNIVPHTVPSFGLKPSAEYNETESKISRGLQEKLNELRIRDNNGCGMKSLEESQRNEQESIKKFQEILKLKTKLKEQRVSQKMSKQEKENHQLVKRTCSPNWNYLRDTQKSHLMLKQIKEKLELLKNKKGNMKEFLEQMDLFKVKGVDIKNLETKIDKSLKQLELLKNKKETKIKENLKYLELLKNKETKIDENLEKLELLKEKEAKIDETLKQLKLLNEKEMITENLKQVELLKNKDTKMNNSLKQLELLKEKEAKIDENLKRLELLKFKKQKKIEENLKQLELLKKREFKVNENLKHLELLNSKQSQIEEGLQKLHTLKYKEIRIEENLRKLDELCKREEDIAKGLRQLDHLKHKELKIEEGFKKFKVSKERDKHIKDEIRNVILLKKNKELEKMQKRGIKDSFTISAISCKPISHKRKPFSLAPSFTNSLKSNPLPRLRKSIKKNKEMYSWCPPTVLAASRPQGGHSKCVADRCCCNYSNRQDCVDCCKPPFVPPSELECSNIVRMPASTPNCKNRIECLKYVDVKNRERITTKIKAPKPSFLEYMKDPMNAQVAKEFCCMKKSTVH